MKNRKQYSHLRLRFDRKAAATARRDHENFSEIDLGSRLKGTHLNIVNISKDDSEYEKELENDEIRREKKQSREKKLRHAIVRVGQIGLALLSAYTIFLIYGLIMTEYQYNENGEIVPVIITADEIENKVAFEQLYRYYIQARNLYEEILRLDYKVSIEEQSKLLATEYESLLDDVSKLVITIDAITVDTKYGQLKSMLLEWVKTDTAVYLQNMSSAILQNDDKRVDEAIAGRNKMYRDFMLLSENMAALGEAISGIDITSMYEWSPEQYVKQVLEGIRGDE